MGEEISPQPEGLNIYLIYYVAKLQENLASWQVKSMA